MARVIELIRPLQIAAGPFREIRNAWGMTTDVRSRTRHSTDVVLYRVLKVIDLKAQGRQREIRMVGATSLVYRLTRGDIQTIREVWVDNVYELPFDLRPRSVIDLGANIGITGVWFSRRYGCSRIIAVEPSPENLNLLRANVARNRVPADVVEAAVGPESGTALFEQGEDTNLGRVGRSGIAVPVVTVHDLLERLPDRAADLVKLDIEGGENALLTGDLSWLRNIKALIAEFHAPLVDPPGVAGIPAPPWVVHLLQDAGFDLVRGGSVLPNSCDAFIRRDYLRNGA